MVRPLLSRTRDVDLAVRWFDPHDHHVATSARSGEVRHILDGHPVPYVARPYKTIMLVEPREPWDLVSLAQQFDLSTTAMASTLRDLPTTSKLVREVHVSDTAVKFVVDFHGRTFHVQTDRWNQDNERLSVPLLVELACAHARHHARVEPTILILDDFLDRYHAPAQLEPLVRLEESVEHAQVAVISHSPHLLARCGPGWTHTSLKTSSNRSDPSRPIDFEVTTTEPPNATAPTV